MGHSKNEVVVGNSRKTLTIWPNVNNPENVNVQKKLDISKIRPHLQNNHNSKNNTNHINCNANYKENYIQTI